MMNENSPISETNSLHARCLENSKNNTGLSHQETIALTRDEFYKIIGEDNPNKHWQTLANEVAESDPEQALAHFPNKIDLSNLDKGSEKILIKILTNISNCKEVWRIIPEKIDLSSICERGAFLIYTLTKHNQGAEVYQRLQKNIDFANLSPDAHQAITGLIKNNPDLDYTRLIPQETELGTMNEALGKYLATFYLEGKKNEVLSLLPAEIDLNTLTLGASSLLQLIAHSDKNGLNRVATMIPGTLDIYNVSAGSASLLDNLITTQLYPENIILDMLPDEIDINKIKEPGQTILDTLSDFFTGEIAAKLTRVDINFSQLTEATAKILKKFAYRYSFNEILSFIPNKIDLKNITMAQVIYLTIILELDKRDAKLIDKIPRTAFSDISVIGAYFLQQAYQNYYSSQNMRNRRIYQKLTPKGKLEDYSTHHHKLLATLERGGFDVKKFKPCFENLDQKLREPLNVSTVEANQTYGISLFEQITTLGEKIITNSVVKLKNGWYKAQLKKSGSSTYVFANFEGDTPKIVFRNEDIPAPSARALERMTQIAPGFVASPGYPELSQAETPKQKVYPHTNQYCSVRESYAGQTVFDFAVVNNLFNWYWQNLPLGMMENIHAQVAYIKSLMLLHDVSFVYNSNHDHERNFNVRFLLEDGNGNKTISFDLNHAIQVAKENDLTLTPIVVLRDWDQGYNIDEPAVVEFFEKHYLYLFGLYSQPTQSSDYKI